MSKLLKSAKEYIKLGISVIATDANKRSVQPWKPYQQRIAPEEELSHMLCSHKTKGMAIVCGAVSGNLEVIDVDSKYDVTGSLFEDFMQVIIDNDQKLAESLVIVKTKSGGYHLMYRCPTITGNKKLAQRHATEEEKKANPHEKYLVLIETRGEGGYVIAAPTDGYTYIQNKPYNIPTITERQREILMECARSFNQVVEEVSHHRHYVEQKTFNKSPFQDFNERGDIIGLLERHGWRIVGEKGPKTIFLRPGNTTSKSSGDYNRDMGLFMVFTTSSEFESMKGYRPAAVYAMLECGGDYKEAARRLLADGFGEPYKRIGREIKKYLRKKKDEGVSGEKLVSKLAGDFDMSADDAKSVIEQHEQEELHQDMEFWSWDSEKEKLGIVYTRFARFLEENGFGLYFYDRCGPIFKLVHNDNNRLEEVSSEKVKKFTQDYIMNYDLEGTEFTKEQLLEIIYRNNNIFSDGLFEFLHPVEIDFLRDTKDTAYFPFKNGLVEIKADTIRLRSYGEIRKVIWKEDIIDFRVDVDLSDDYECEFSDFVGKICAGNKDRILYMCSIIGYMLHKFKHPARPYMPIFGEETDDDSKGGGTGKGIFTKAFNYMLSVETIDGKTFKADKSFAMQRIKLSTKLIIFQDLQKGFDIEKLYSMITEGITVEKKNKDELYIRYDDSPKMAATTNYTVDDSAQHARRRIKVVEFAPHFSTQHTPLDEYGHLLFDDWDQDEWNRFYNFMFWCVRYYLYNGVNEQQQGDQYRQKKIKVQFGEEFLSWFQDYAANGCAEWKEGGTLYTDFLGVNDMERRDYSQKRFKKALAIASDNFGKSLEVRKNSQNNGKVEYRLV
ncbi:bifunctional DNA primase/polymerase [Chitinophaga japonensis]|uniref:Bifunctional DNA primase/polymerase-like protein n=1 Tax=Chitinophaga japonensis TaxID=104662 RepID=A0A562SZ78_CHIJA|nr:bifunctional DNA primase/polymerase [Chitinophaga japonensis]TWI86324.1 bifunctional DNA primase/polymerase-like protein [Chitinophaga japonensis]